MSLVGFPTLPTPLSPASVPLPPEPGEGGTLARGWGVGGVTIPTTGEKALHSCLLCGYYQWFYHPKNLRVTYTDVDGVTVTPGRPPPILINETYAACGTSAFSDGHHLHETSSVLAAPYKAAFNDGPGRLQWFVQRAKYHVNFEKSWAILRSFCLILSCRFCIWLLRCIKPSPFKELSFFHLLREVKIGVQILHFFRTEDLIKKFTRKVSKICVTYSESLTFLSLRNRIHDEW